ncbi:MAG: anaerobic sulfatase maturase [Armatimonadetes bacterium]|nr:anaerobic sulfatase maturase [Armatimonadota bacterium]
MAKPTGPICNLDCTYCFYLDKERLYPQTRNWAMPPDVLEAHIRQYIEANHRQREISFAWQGGEPTLLGVDFFRRVVELQKQYGGGRRIENAFQTNGVLLDDAWAEFLKENDFLVGISIDGPAHLHDPYRVDRGGQPTFARVMRGLEFLKKHEVRFNTITVVNAVNAPHPLEVYEFMKSLGSTFLQFIPLVERNDDGSMNEQSVPSLAWGQFLSAIFDAWVRADIGKIFVQLFDVALESWLFLPQSLCFFRETCGAALALEHNGDLYACDHFVTLDNRLGNIMDQPMATLTASALQKKFGDDKRDMLPEYCRKCDYRFACNGECPKNRFTKTPDGEDGLNYLCAGYKHFFGHIDPYMRYMAQQIMIKRPPAEIMEAIRAAEENQRAEL